MSTVAGCRLEAQETVQLFLPIGIAVVAIDFCGSGLSDGNYVTLGWYERVDLKAVVDFLRSDSSPFMVDKIALWYRELCMCYRVPQRFFSALLCQGKINGSCYVAILHALASERRRCAGLFRAVPVRVCAFVNELLDRFSTVRTAICQSYAENWSAKSLRLKFRRSRCQVCAQLRFFYCSNSLTTVCLARGVFHRQAR